MLCVTKLFFGGQSTQCFNGLGLRLSKCQHFQENVNETRNGVNDIRKTVNSFSKSTVNHIRK